MPDEKPAATIIAAKVPADDPDRATGLTGWAKVVTTVGAVGFVLVAFGFVLQRMVDTIPASIKVITDEHREDIKIERDRADKNRTHGDEIVKQIYERDRQKTKELTDVMREQTEELAVIRKLAYERNQMMK